MSTDSIDVYVPLLNEGTEVFRPTRGTFVGPDVVRLEATPDYDPDLEEWQFPPGSVVRCVAELRSNGLILVARERIAAARSA